MVSHDARRAHLLKAKLRVAMKVTPPRDELGLKSGSG
jgi:hypothetical protein